jgi:hypothetical protein
MRLLRDNVKPTCKEDPPFIKVDAEEERSIWILPERIKRKL